MFLKISFQIGRIRAKHSGSDRIRIRNPANVSQHLLQYNVLQDYYIYVSRGGGGGGRDDCTRDYAKYRNGTIFLRPTQYSWKIVPGKKLPQYITFMQNPDLE